MSKTGPLPFDTRHGEALFRYRLVCEIKSRLIRGEKKTAIVSDMAKTAHPDLRGQLRRVTERSLYRWLANHAEADFSGLLNKPKERIERSTVLEDDLLDFIVAEHDKDPRASIPELIRRAREYNILDANGSIDRTTLYRACQRMGLAFDRRKQCRERDTRRFAYPHRMQMMLCDGKHFRAGITRARRVALFFLDDCSRYGIHAVVGTSENTELFLRGLYETTCLCGFADIYYIDEGPGFIATDTADVIRQCQRALIHGEKAYPEGRGKIEKFNQTALHDIIRSWDGRADIDPAPRALELRLQHYLHDIYDHRPHASLDNRTPHACFFADKRPLRFPDSDEDLRKRFVVRFTRLVSNDHIVSIDSIAYEVPCGYRKQMVVLQRAVLDNIISIQHQGKWVTLHPVDLAANATSRRAQAKEAPEEPAVPLPKSAADLAFERSFSSVVDDDGWFTDTALPPAKKGASHA